MSKLEQGIANEYELDRFSELKPQCYPVELSELDPAEELRILREHPPKSYEAFISTINELIWQLISYRTGKMCPICDSDELIALIDPNVSGDSFVFTCDRCTWTQPPPGNPARYTPSMRYLLLEEVQLDDDELKNMCNLAAEMFRIEKSTTLESSVSAFISFLKWTEKAGARQDSLKRAIKVWFIRAQKPAKIIDYDDAIEKMDLEELVPMLSERMEKFQNELIAEGRRKGQAEGRAEAETTIFINLFEEKFGSISDETRARVKASNSETLSVFFKKLLSAEKPDDIFG